MKTDSSKIISFTVLLMVFFIMLTGCNDTKPKPITITKPSCPIPSGNLVDEAFQTARSTLSQPECRYQFESTLNALLIICKGNPGEKHKQAFSDFLMWAKGEGIISTIQAKEYYNRYFSHKFISMPDNYRTCGYCRQLKKIMSDGKDELRQKEMGLLKVCRDKESFAKASSDFKAIELILEATCSACAAE